MVKYIIIFIVLFALEVVYFKVAAYFGIVDRPNQRSSHQRIVLRGGGIIFTVSLWVWSIVYAFPYPWMLASVTIAACVSFMDDIHSLPIFPRLFVQCLSLLLIFHEIGLLSWEIWWMIPVALFVSLTGTNIYNFMDGINGITGAYSLSILIPLFLLNRRIAFVEESLLVFVGLSLLVFCFFNFRSEARCFAGDVGSIGIAMILVFLVGRLMLASGDICWIVLMMVYGCDGMMTIFHRMLLHENLGEPHRKHAYQLMVNELKMKHLTVSSFYLCSQMVISLVFIYVIPDTVLSRWIYLVVVAVLMMLGYILLMKKYYHLHEEYLAVLESKGGER